jgi:hypothetical protein
MQPGSRRSFLKGQRQSSMQSLNELHNRGRFGLQQAFHSQLANSIHHWGLITHSDERGGRRKGQPRQNLPRKSSIEIAPHLDRSWAACLRGKLSWRNIAVSLTDPRRPATPP